MRARYLAPGQALPGSFMPTGRTGAARLLTPLLLALPAAAVPDAAVAQTTRPPSALAAFDLAAEPAARWTMPRRLRELSGLATTGDGRLFAHDDERALIYEIDPARGTLVKTFALVSAGDPVAPGAPGAPARPLRGDFEGLAVAAGRVYLVTSDGIVHESAEGRDGEQVTARALDTGLGARCEIEGLGFEPAGGGILLLACKAARRGTPADAVTVFCWSLASRALLTSSPALHVPLAEIARAGGPPNAFAASGIDRDPRTGNYVLVAARQRALAEITPAGRLVAALRLPARRHPQAEGLAFLPDGSLLLGDEGEKGREAGGTVTVYHRAR